MTNTSKDYPDQSYWDHFEGGADDGYESVHNTPDTPDASGSSSTSSTPKPRKAAARRVRKQGDPRVELNLESFESDEQILEAIAEIAAKSGVYADGAKRLCEVQGNALWPLDQHSVSVRIGTDIYFTGAKPGTPPPLRLAHELLSHPKLFPRIAGVTACPVVSLNGSVISAGYDPVTTLFVAPAVELDTAELPDTPAACAEELIGLVSDFPFAAEVDKGAWLALVITSILRPVILGPVPGFVVTATTRGTGKTLLVETAAALVCGPNVAISPEPPNPEEARKVIVSTALRGSRFMIWDNLQNGKPFGSALIDSLLTTRTYSGRVLGTNTLAEFDIPFVLVATGNNTRFAADTSRRVLVCKLQTDLERPEDRADYRIENLRGYTLSKRPRLLAVAIQLIRLGLASHARAPRVGSFEHWAASVGKIIAAAGFDLKAVLASTDPDADETENYRACLNGFIFKRGPKGYTTLQLLKEILDHEMATPEAAEAAEAMSGLSDGRVRTASDACLAGRVLASFKNATIRGLVLRQRKSHGVMTWRVEEATG